MLGESRLRVISAYVIVAAAIVLGFANTLKDTAFWALIGTGIGLFVVGACLYAAGAWRQRRSDRQQAGAKPSPDPGTRRSKGGA